jgi:cytochrome c-type biogenesis protein CcmH/NrfG
MRTNLLFAWVVGLLGAVAVTFMYLNSDRHVIQEAAVSEPSSILPENHPPTDMASGLAALEQMSLKDPQNAEYKTQIANTYYDLGQYQKAVSAYQESLNLRPQDPNVETDLATCFHYLGQHDKALELLNKVLEYQPDFPKAMFNKGIVLVAGKNDIRAGITVWENLLLSDPTFPKRAELEQRIRQLKASLK